MQVRMARAKGLDAGDAKFAASFGDRLKKLRSDAGLDATALGQRCGLTQAAMWRLEAGKALPTLPTLARLAFAREVPITELLVDVDYQDVRLVNRPYEPR